MAFSIEPMQVEHIAAVMAVERLSFPVPWPASAYKKEIQSNRLAHYFVARQVDDDGAPVIALPDDDVGRATNGNGDGILGRLARWIVQDPTPRVPDDVSQAQEARSVMGYAGMWILAGSDAHITTIAVHPLFRGRGIGELLLIRCIERALVTQAERMTLEVRVSNSVAKRLYEKYRFEIQGRRPRYYSDNGEDAEIMTTPLIDTPTYRALLAQNSAEVEARLVREK
ncbi:MAG: ribosomal protein S18-alanine N-acetyltransferase [Chloroflexota bacterium]